MWNSLPLNIFHTIETERRKKNEKQKTTTTSIGWIMCWSGVVGHWNVQAMTIEKSQPSLHFSLALNVNYHNRSAIAMITHIFTECPNDSFPNVCRRKVNDTLFFVVSIMLCVWSAHKLLIHFTDLFMPIQLLFSAYRKRSIITNISYRIWRFDAPPYQVCNVCFCSLCFVSFFIHRRLNSSLVGLVAISANPTTDGASSMLSNGAQRTVAPSIVKPIHNGTTMSLVNVTPAEPSNTSKSRYFCYYLLHLLSFRTHQIHHSSTCIRQNASK